MAKISVLGAGSWGTALSVLLNNNGHEVRLWSRFQEEVDTLKQTRELTSKLPGVHIPENIDLTADVKNCVETAEVIVLAVPSPYVRGTAELMAPYVKDEQIIVNVAKGIEEKTLMTMTDIISEEIPACGGSGKRDSDDLCDQRTEERDSRIPSGDFYEPCISCVYNTGYTWRRAGWFSEKCHCSCCRYSRWTWLW